MYIKAILEESKQNSMVGALMSAQPNADAATEEEKTETKTIAIDVFNNMAAVFIKQQKFQKAKEFSGKALISANIFSRNISNSFYL